MFTKETKNYVLLDFSTVIMKNDGSVFNTLRFLNPNEDVFILSKYNHNKLDLKTVTTNLFDKF